MVTLYRKNSLGISTWRIWNEGNVLYYAHATVEGGAEVTHAETIQLNQSGRSLEQQIELQMLSRINRQRDKGYKDSRAEALQGSTNQLGLINPMLAQPLEKVRNVDVSRGVYVQPKFDGHRCLITKQDGDIIAYSRKGKIIETIDHIVEDVRNWLPDGYTLDGELYLHGKPLQTISSLIKRMQPDSKLLNFHFYDIATGEPFSERYREMDEMAKHIATPAIQLVPTNLVHDMEDVYNMFNAYRANGYEGAMMRRPLRGYEDAKRSDQLIKVKARMDGEAKVVGLRPSKDGWAILTVDFDSGNGRHVIFDVSAPGTVPQKLEVMQNWHKYLEKWVTIEYANLTADGIPFHCVATRWREDIE